VDICSIMSDPVQLTDRQKELLLPIETEKKYGYKGDSFSLHSEKRIVHKCDVCGLPKENTFGRFAQNVGLAHVKCRIQKIQQTFTQRYGVKSTFQMSGFQEKSKQTCFEKYGVEYTAQTEQKKEKTRKTNLEKYGAENSQQNPEVREKRRQTCLSRYGTENVSAMFKEKRRQTCLDKYGVEYSAQSAIKKEKTEKTCTEKYGVRNTSLVPEIREKQRQTCLKKYGTACTLDVPEIRQKQKQTLKERYGVDNPQQLPQNRNRLKEWCIENPDKVYTTKGEIEILEWVRQCYPEAKKYREEKYEIDIFIPSINVGIEYNGLYHHQETIKGKDYHFNKTKYFENRDIQIIHIFEHEWKQKNKQTKSFLQSAIGKQTHQISLEKCRFEWLSDKKDIQTIHQFLIENDLHGKPPNTKCAIKVYHCNEIVAVATFKYSYERWILSCFHAVSTFLIPNILLKISELASQNLNSDLWCRVDYRLSSGGEYRKASWTLERMLPLKCFYTNGYRVSPKPLSGQKNNYKLWDCGALLYKYSRKDK